MANLENIAQVKARLLKVTIGADTAPYEAEIEVAVDYVRADIVPLAQGEAIGEVILGRSMTGSITFQQFDPAFLKRVMSVAGSPAKALAVGAQPTFESLTIHDPQDADATGDLYAPRVRFLNLRLVEVGEGIRGVQVDFRAFRVAASGDIWQIGAPG